MPTPGRCTSTQLLLLPVEPVSGAADSNMPFRLEHGSSSSPPSGTPSSMRVTASLTSSWTRHFPHSLISMIVLNAGSPSQKSLHFELACVSLCLESLIKAFLTPPTRGFKVGFLTSCSKHVAWTLANKIRRPPRGRQAVKVPAGLLSC